MPPNNQQPILILGAGINGCATARELALNGVPLCVVDAADIATGATAKSSRLIHGGLRYLEYGEIGLVRESLRERDRLMRLAPQFVRPLELFIPVRQRLGGWLAAARKFLGWREPVPPAIPSLALQASADRAAHDLKPEAPARELRPQTVSGTRGLWVIRLGLWFYNWFSTGLLGRGRVVAAGATTAPTVDPVAFRWLCSYWDGQVLYPERLTLALLEDARRCAVANRTGFDLFTYHQCRFANGAAELIAREGTCSARFWPAAIVNASGAWGDATLASFGVPSRPLFGGTKGSHIFTYNADLRTALRGSGVYAEAADGRLVFVLPAGDAVMIGTTDIRFADPPDRAVASDEEIGYLLDMANAVFAPLKLTRDDVAFHYCGVRPLPAAAGMSASAVTRRHFIERHECGGLPVFTLIGGKLTTCRSFGASAADAALTALGRPRIATTEDRPIPGGESYPATDEELHAAHVWLADRFGLTAAAVVRLWELFGTRLEGILEQIVAQSQESLVGSAADAAQQSADAIAMLRQPLRDSWCPIGVVRWMIENEWVETISDLIERRLMLVYDRQLTASTVRHLAEILADSGTIEPDKIDAEVASATNRLREFYGRKFA